MQVVFDDRQKKDLPRVVAPGRSFRLAVGIGLRLSTLVASANQLDSISSDARFRAEALSLSHLTWDTTVTIRFHIFWITLLSSVRRKYHSPPARSNQFASRELVRRWLRD